MATSPQPHCKSFKSKFLCKHVSFILHNLLFLLEIKHILEQEHEFTPCFQWDSCCSIVSFLSSVLQIIVCPSSIYGFRFLLWYPQTFLICQYAIKNNNQTKIPIKCTLLNKANKRYALKENADVHVCSQHTLLSVFTHHGNDGLLYYILENSCTNKYLHCQYNFDHSHGLMMHIHLYLNIHI